MAVCTFYQVALLASEKTTKKDGKKSTQGHKTLIKETK